MMNAFYETNISYLLDIVYLHTRDQLYRIIFYNIKTLISSLLPLMDFTCPYFDFSMNLSFQ